MRKRKATEGWGNSKTDMMYENKKAGAYTMPPPLSALQDIVRAMLFMIPLIQIAAFKLQCVRPGCTAVYAYVRSHRTGGGNGYIRYNNGNRTF